MNFEETDIKRVFKVIPRVLGDDRGGFFRFFCKKEFAAITSKQFVQMNHSINAKKGTLRGLHYQQPPHAEDKLVRCVKGKIWDVFIDLRKESPTFLQWRSAVLSEENKEMLFLPKGIAHGFITLEDDTHVLYHHTEYYNPESERGFRYDDQKLKIDWPVEMSNISQRDEEHPFIADSFKGLEI